MMRKINRLIFYDVEVALTVVCKSTSEGGMLWFVAYRFGFLSWKFVVSAVVDDNIVLLVKVLAQDYDLWISVWNFWYGCLFCWTYWIRILLSTTPSMVHHVYGLQWLLTGLQLITVLCATLWNLHNLTLILYSYLLILLHRLQYNLLNRHIFIIMNTLLVDAAFWSLSVHVRFVMIHWDLFVVEALIVKFKIYEFLFGRQSIDFLASLIL